jgi:hypothetical protein
MRFPSPLKELHDPSSLGHWFEHIRHHPVFHVRDINAKAEMNRYWKDLNTWVSAAVALPEDTESIRIRKTTIALVTMAIVPINLAWTASFFSLGLNVVAGINLATGIMFTAVIVFLYRTRKFKTYLNIMILIAMIYSCCSTFRTSSRIYPTQPPSHIYLGVCVRSRIHYIACTR